MQAFRPAASGRPNGLHLRDKLAKLQGAVVQAHLEAAKVLDKGQKRMTN